ncbi:hypothetical protein DS745_09105 [Anaerobacillus alkaliphilus]|uniref:Uncharacterized protein n=1 Tax=Anaerobacillus alkaliphilus TaxID=1548597 RepID=A0A4Q0VTN7_9BACI|nr:hypothetical protein [Anaerobacillus alkaliphilus]RXJ01629.1 hypothetical protein DS745_09105 [Anaerobacillus alkaliphilus]
MVEELVNLAKEYQEIAELSISYKKQNKVDEISKLMRERGNVLTIRITETSEQVRTYQGNQLHFTIR